jgi:hypothetical protein
LGQVWNLPAGAVGFETRLYDKSITI